MENLAYKIFMRMFRHPLLLLSRNFISRKNLDWKTSYEIPNTNHNIILSGLPPDNYLHNNHDNIHYVINMTDEFTYGELISEFKYKHNKTIYLYKLNKLLIYQIPVVDYCPPDFDDIMAAIKLLNMFFNSNHPKNVLVHCKSGVGRSATIVMCYLYYHHRIIINNPKSIDDIHTFIRSKRNQVKDAIKDYESVHQLVKSIVES